MAYIVKSDLRPYITDTVYSQIDNTGGAIFAQAIEAAQSKVRSYLSQRFDCTQELKDLLPFNPQYSYGASDRVIYDYPAWVSTTPYAPNQCVIYQGFAYLAVFGSTNSIPATDNSNANWMYLGKQYDINYVTYPAPVFDYTFQNYIIGYQVWWKGKVYTCRQNNPQVANIYSDSTYIPYPYPNGVVFPDDPNYGQATWGVGVPYALQAGLLPVGNPAYWTYGDNRYQLLVQITCHIALADIATRLSPNNIPSNRKDDRDNAMAWLDSARKGEIQTDLPEIQIAQGRRIRWGSNPRNINYY